MVDFPKSFYFIFIVHIVVLQPPDRRNDQSLGYSAFARHYLRNHYCFLFLSLLRCFSSGGMLPRKDTMLAHGGLPHSEIPGSQLLCSSPRLIAALHVLHRLCMPRHPPCALNCFVYRTCTFPASRQSRQALH